MTILGRSEGLVSRCVECDLAEPESLASLGGSAPGVVDGILSMTMSTFRQDPRVGHLQCIKRIFGYLTSLPHGAIRYRIHEPDYSDLPHKEYDWARTVYTGTKEDQ